MRKHKLIGRVVPGAVILAFAISGGTAFAQSGDNPEVRIQGAPVVTTEGWSRTGIQTQTVQLTSNVSYSDLNLATSSGASELKARVHDAAAEVCSRLGNSQELRAAIDSEEHHIQCVNGAVDNAMPQVRRVIASAEQTQRG